MTDDGCKDCPVNISFWELTNINRELQKENKSLKELLEIISDADSIYEQDSVKEIVRDYIRALYSVSDTSPSAWNDYALLSQWFRKHYGQRWTAKYD